MGLAGCCRILYNCAIDFINQGSRIREPPPLSLINAIASLLGLSQFPAFSGRRGGFSGIFNSLGRPAGAAAAIFPDGREFAGRNAPTRTLSKRTAELKGPTSLAAGLPLVSPVL